MIESACGNSLYFSERTVTLEGTHQGCHTPGIFIFPRPEEPRPPIQEISYCRFANRVLTRLHNDSRDEAF